MSFNNKKIAIFLPILLGVALAAGVIIGVNLNINRENSNDRIFIYPRSSNKLNDVLNLIEEEYVDTISKNSLIEKTIPELLKQLDPHSVYIPASEVAEMNEPLEGNFEGIGVQFNMPEDTVVVITTISGGPSERLGILPGDRIIKINDSLVAGKKIANTEIVKKLKGPKGTKVKVTILRKGVKDPLNYDIIRDKIPLYSLDIAFMITKDIGYIKISRFARTTYEEFKEAVKKLNNQNCKKIILDLRGNGGGYLDAATDIANEFLPSGKLIVYTQGKAQPKKEIFAKSKGSCLDKELVILIDEWSASASEILTGAIQDNDRGTIIGRRSFGKGLVQNQQNFPDGSALRLTIARYYTPTGRSIQRSYKNGIEDYYEDMERRYENGELRNKDSIHFNDSLKYKTPKGKIVYGGGGIMPDIFVPIDTSGFSSYYKDVINKGIVYRFSFEYADQNRQTLGRFKTAAEMQDYLEKQKILDKFVIFAEKNGIKKDKKALKVSAQLLTIQLEASIARDIIDNEGFYPIISEIDNTLKKARDLLDNKKEDQKKKK